MGSWTCGNPLNCTGDATRDVSSGGRGHGQEASIACTIIVADHGRVEGAATNTRRHGYRLSVGSAEALGSWLAPGSAIFPKMSKK